MAEDTLAKTGIPMNPTGMNDNTPLEKEPNFYETNGIHSLSEKCLQRCNGKKLDTKFDSPVLAIHGDLRGIRFIETVTQLLMITDDLDEEPETVTFVDTPSVHWIAP